MYKSLITFLFWCITTILWSQKNLRTDFEKKLVSDILQLADKFKKMEADTKRYMFSSTEDSIIKNKIIRSNIIKKALNYIGVNYRYGQSSEKGFDCSGFVKFIFQGFGLILPHSSHILYEISSRIAINNAQCGDLVFFITRGKAVSHVGIYLGNNQFIHSPGKGRTVSIDSLNTYYYKRHLAGFGSVL